MKPWVSKSWIAIFIIMNVLVKQQKQENYYCHEFDKNSNMNFQEAMICHISLNLFYTCAVANQFCSKPASSKSVLLNRRNLHILKSDYYKLIIVLWIYLHLFTQNVLLCEIQYFVKFCMSRCNGTVFWFEWNSELGVCPDWFKLSEKNSINHGRKLNFCYLRYGLQSWQILSTVN